MVTPRDLNSDEEGELEHYLVRGLEVVPLPAGIDDIDAKDPALLVLGIGTVVDSIRSGEPLPEGLTIEELSTSLGVLLGEELSRCAGWRWVHLSFEDGFDALAVADTRGGLAMLPIHYIYGLLSTPESENNLGLLFAMIRRGETPDVEPGDWRILG